MSPETINQKPFIKIDTAEKWWIERSRKNFYYFMSYLTSKKRVPTKHQLLWAKEILDPETRRVNLIAPRGSGKTDLTIYVMAWFIGKYPHLTNFIGSVSLDQAKKRLDAIRDIILHDPRYNNVFPWIQIDSRKPNNSSEFTVWSTLWNGKPQTYGSWKSILSKVGEPKGRTLYASSLTAKGLVGSRITGIATLDDPHDEENSGTQYQRDKVDSFVHKVLIPCLVPNGISKIVVISTRWHEDDLAGRLKDMEITPGEKYWKTLEIVALDKNGKSYWEEMYSTDFLNSLKKSNSVIFELMYMNNPTGKSSGDFTLQELFKRRVDDLPDFAEIIITVDIAYSVSTRADYTVYMAIGRTRDQKFKAYVIDIDRFKEDKNSKKTERLVEFADKIFFMYGRLDGIYFHHQTGETAQSIELKDQARDLPVYTVKTKGSKSARLKAVVDIFYSDRMLFYKDANSLEVLFNELIDFPGRHDDTVDALTLAFQIQSWRDKAMQRSGIKMIKGYSI